MDEQIAGTKIRKERKAQRIYEPIKPEDFLKIINSVKKLKHKVILLLAYGSGLRLSEILNLLPDDIDIKNRTIFVRQ